MARVAAEITTPALLDVVATCPNCGERAAMSLYVSAALEVEDDGSSIKLKSKSKKQDHVCGQIALPTIGEVAEGQTALLDAVADAAEAEGHEVSRGEDGTLTITEDLDKPRRGRPRKAAES